MGDCFSKKLSKSNCLMNDSDIIYSNNISESTMKIRNDTLFNPTLTDSYIPPYIDTVNYKKRKLNN